MKTNFFYLLFLFFVVLFSSCSEEQIEEKDVNQSGVEQHDPQKCAFDEVQKRALERNPQLKSIIQQNEAKIAKIINSDEFKKSKNSIITIPVVFNVIRKMNGGTSIWDLDFHYIEHTQIRQQLKILNDFFSEKGALQSGTPDQFAELQGNPRIKFTLKKIQRTRSKKSWNVNNEDMKYKSKEGIDAFKPDEYVNIWVCQLSGASGAAYKPGGAPSTKEDGIVIDYRYFGRNPKNQRDYNQGKTLVHEMGHFLNLDHPFLDGCTGDNDKVADTPAMTKPDPRRDYSCYPDARSRTTCGSLDMTMNLMSYGLDECLTMFTKGQVARMRATLASGGPREDWVE